MKVAPRSRAADHGHDGKGGNFIPPLEDNTPPRGVAPRISGRIGYSTPHNGVWSPDEDGCALSIQTSNVFFATDDGKRPKQILTKIRIININQDHLHQQGIIILIRF